MQSGKAKSKSSSYQEMRELMWMPFFTTATPSQPRDFLRSIFECSAFKAWLHKAISGPGPYQLHVSGLDWNTKKDDLQRVFEQVGRCKISLEPPQDSSSSHKTNGRGTVTFEDRHHAAAAQSLFNKSTYSGRVMTLVWDPALGAAKFSASSALAGAGGSAHAASAHVSSGGSGAVASVPLPGFQPELGVRGGGLAAAPAPYVHHLPAAPMPSVSPLPVGWIEQRSPEGIPFYVHTPTAHTTWDRPSAPPPQPSVPPLDLSLFSFTSATTLPTTQQLSSLWDERKWKILCALVEN